MKYNKKQNLNILSIFLAVIMISGSLLYGNIKNNNQEKELIWKNLSEKTDIKGVSEQINDDWNLYTNKAFGFQLEYPRREFPYGRLKVREDKIRSLRYITDDTLKYVTYFSVGFHPEDSQGVYIDIEKSEYRNLNDYIQHFIKKGQIPNKPKILFTTKKIKISGYDATLIYFTNLNSDLYPDINIEKIIFIIKDGILYRFSTWYLTPEENARIWKSFKFLD